MKKIESARIIAKQKGYCRTVHCKDCFITEKCYKVDEKTSDVLQRFMSAEAYIKRHEGKSKKRIVPTKYTADVQPDKTNAECKRVVTLPKDKRVKCINDSTVIPNVLTKGKIYEVLREDKDFYYIVADNGITCGYNKDRFVPATVKPNYYHTVDPNEKKVESVLTTTPDMSNPTPLDIAKNIRDNGYRCESLTKNCFMYSCPFGLSSEPECPKKNRDIAKRIIDDYIAKNDHIVDKHEKVDPQPTEPKPISFDVPDVVYTTMDNGIMFVSTKGKNMGIINGKLTVGISECYRTPEEALAVALKRWQK